MEKRNPSTEREAQERVDHVFAYHRPVGDQVELYEQVRSAGHEMASEILRLCPDSMERDEAIKKIRETVMWANASIALNE